MRILIPIAGNGSRFTEKGFPCKPLTLVNGKPMISKVIENLGNHKYAFVLQDSPYRKDIVKAITSSTENVEFYITEPTQGAACTALVARSFIKKEALMITNCDQIILDWDYTKILSFLYLNDPDGILGGFISNSPKNSYMKIEEGLVKEVREKMVISQFATNGVHIWSNGFDFIESAEQMISENNKEAGEYYIAPTFNYLIDQGKKIMPFMFNLHYPIGTPEDLEKYEKI